MWPSFRRRSSQRQDMSRVSIFWNKIVFAFFTFSAFKTFPCCCLNVFETLMLLHLDLLLGIVIHRHCWQVSQGEAETSMNLSADPLVPVQPRPFFDDRLSEKGTSLFLEFSLSQWIPTQFSHQMAPNPIVATELSQPTLEYIDTGVRHSDVLTKTPLENENDTKTPLWMKMTRANNCVWWECWVAEWEHFEGVSCAWALSCLG